MSIEVPFTKENLEYYLKALAKEFRKRGHGVPAEIILVGGASVLINYSFRMASYDIDATYACETVMKEAIAAVRDKYGLQNDWLNDAFKRTSSYTPKLRQYSDHYKTFSNVLEVRTVRAEYLVAMKLVSARQYKKDLSDIVGIIYEQQLAGDPLTLEKIDKAVKDLYGDWLSVKERAKNFLERVLACDDLPGLMQELAADELSANAVLSEISKKYPGTINKNNVDDVIAAVMKKKGQNNNT